MNYSSEKYILNNTLFRTLYENLPIGIIVMAIPHRNPVMVNREACLLLGYTEEELVAMNVESITHPEDQGELQLIIRSLLSKEITSVNLEKRCITKNGEIISVNLDMNVIRDDNESSEFIVFTLVGIPSMNRSEKKLVRSQVAPNIEKTNKELKEIIDALDQSSLVSLTDKKGTILKVNKRFCEVARYSEEELLGQNHRLINSGYHSKEFWEQFWKTLRRGEIWRGEIKNKAKDGTEYWVDSVINPIRNEHGEVIQYLSIRQDITGRKVYENLLLQSNFRLAQIEQFVDLTTDAIQVSNEQGSLVYINKVAAERMGIPQEECSDFSVGDFNPALSSSVEWSEHLEALKRNELLSTEGWNKNIKTGNTFPVEITARYVTIQDKGYTVAIARDIRERKKSEVALRESQARLQDAQRMAGLGSWEYDLSSKKLWLSDELYEMFKIDRTDTPFGPEKVINLLHPDDKDWVRVSFKNATARDSLATFRVICNDGQVRIVQGKARVTFNYNRERTKMSGVIQDITERVLAERALEESELTLRKAQQVAKIGSWKLDVKNNVLKWSDEVYRIFNAPLGKDLTNEDFLSYVHPEDKAYVDASWNAALKGDQYDIVHRIIVDNKIKWVREQAELTFDESRNLTIGLGTVQDITDQKALQEAVLIFNQSQFLTGFGSWRWSIKTQEVFWSDNMYNLFDTDKESLKSSCGSYSNAIHPEDRSRVDEMLQTVVKTKQRVELEYRVNTKNGVVRWVSNKVNLLCNHQGDPIEVYGVVRDITVEKRNVDEINTARKQAEEAAAVKDEFLSVMSHEIRTPLNSVIGLSNLLLKRSPREDQLEIMKTLKGAADNLLHLVTDILDFNKIRAGKVELEFIPFSITTFLQHLQASFKLSAFEKGLEFTVQSDTRIPETLLGDVTRLNQIFNNLLCNAIKFTHRGYVKFQVDLKTRIEKRCVLTFKIEDTGIGIAADKMDSIFKPFHQSARDISRKYGGTGLGLSIVNSLVEILGGKLSVSSELANGSAFSVELTFEVPHKAGRVMYSDGTGTHVNKTIPITRKDLTILYVEDVDSNRFLIEKLFTDNHINCTSASSGKSALKFTKRKKFDVILMDIQMPGMDGYQATEQIRSQVDGKNVNTPVIAFTAEPYSEVLRNRILQHGLQDVMTKPFDFDSLFEKIVEHAKPKSPRSELMSFRFYEEAFDHDKTKLKKLKKSIIADVRRFETKVMHYTRIHDVKKMRDEVHRIKPIINNLECKELVTRLDQYRLQETFTTDINRLTKDVIRITKRLLVQLEKLKY